MTLVISRRLALKDVQQASFS